MSNKLKFGIVGPEDHPQWNILSAIKNVSDRCEVELIPANTEEPLNLNLDALILSSYTKSKKYIDWALKNNKHILSDAHLFSNANEASSLIEEINQKKLKFMIGHRFIFHPMMNDISNVIKEENLGSLKFINVMLSGKPDVTEFGLGPSYSLGLQAIHLIRTVFKEEPIEVFAFAQRGICEILKGHDEAVTIILKYKNQKMAHCYLSFKTHSCCEIEIIGERGKLKVEDLLLSNKTHKLNIYESGRIITRRYHSVDSTSHMLANFCDSILKKKELLSSVDQNLKDLKILDAINLSIDLGTPISLKEISERISNKKKTKIPFFAKPRFNL